MASKLKIQLIQHSSSDKASEYDGQKRISTNYISLLSGEDKRHRFSLHIQTIPITMYTTVNMQMLTSITITTITYTHSNYCMVMWSPKVTYSNVLKFLNTRGSANAMDPSSPISLHWNSSHSRLYIHQEAK